MQICVYCGHCSVCLGIRTSCCSLMLPAFLHTWMTFLLTQLTTHFCRYGCYAFELELSHSLLFPLFCDMNFPQQNPVTVVEPNVWIEQLAVHKKFQPCGLHVIARNGKPIQSLLRQSVSEWFTKQLPILCCNNNYDNLKINLHGEVGTIYVIVVRKSEKQLGHKGIEG